MTTLVFPEAAEDWATPFNNALSQGVFGNDPTRHSFWGHYELQASETEDGAVIADWFHQRNTLEFKRIEREDKP